MFFCKRKAEHPYLHRLTKHLTLTPRARR
jgi:hypothetical protein